MGKRKLGALEKVDADLLVMPVPSRFVVDPAASFVYRQLTHIQQNKSTVQNSTRPKVRYISCYAV